MTVKMVKDIQRPDGRKPFPKLMISEGGRVVYFIREAVGTDLTDGSHGNTWMMDHFSDLVGSITLSNQ